jgi:phosphate starvation-inducible PhoH-like protein
MNFLLLFCLFSSMFSSLSYRKTAWISMRVKKVKMGSDFGNSGLSYNQNIYHNALHNLSLPIVACVGPAGTGKTYIACNTAIHALKSGLVDKIVITRPIAPVDDEQLGFLPGSLIHKMDPWTRPIFDIFSDSFSTIQIKSMVKNGVIEVEPLAFMRGRTFKRSFIIADEMQNSSPNQMLMILTRIGLGSRLVLTGDMKQTDRFSDNGLLDFIDRLRLRPIDDICVVHLNTSDICRSPIVSSVLRLYDPL